MNAIISWRETQMARQMNAINQALLYLEVIKRIPRHRFISTQEIQNSLLASGINIQTLTLQRYLKQLYESGSLPLERNDNSKPFSYRMGTDTSPFPFTNLSAQEALMLRLIEANLRYQLPGKLNKAMQPFFDAARQTLDDIQGRITHENEWLNKIAVVSNSLPQIPPNIKPRIFEAVSNALFENKKLKIEVVTERLELGKDLISAVPHAATLIKGEGVYSGKERYIFTMVVSSYELKNVIHFIKKKDPMSFVEVTPLSQVYGRFYTKPVK